MASKEAVEYCNSDINYGFTDDMGIDERIDIIEMKAFDAGMTIGIDKRLQKQLSLKNPVEINDRDTLIKQLQDDVDKYTKLWEESYAAWCQLSEKTKWHYISEGDLPLPLRKHQTDDNEYLVAMLGNYLKIVTGTTIATDMADGQFIYAWCELPKIPEAS